MKTRWSVLAAVLGASCALGVPAVLAYLMFAPPPRTEAPDWQTVYRALRAQGRTNEAFDLLFSAKLAADPAAYRLLADEIEAGVYPASLSAGGAPGARETAGHIAFAQASYARTMTANHRLSDLRVLIQDAWPYGFAFTLRDTWISQRCSHHFLTPAIDADHIQRAVAEAEGRLYAPSPRERSKQRCSDAALSFAHALEDGRYGDPARSRAAEWFNEAMIWSLPGEHEADVDYAIRVLDGRIAPPPDETRPASVAGPYAGAERRALELTLLSAAWDGYVPAQLAAARLLLDGRIGEASLRTVYGPAGEAYVLLLLAERSGAAVGDAPAAAKAQLNAEAIKALDAEIPASRGAYPQAGGASER